MFEPMPRPPEWKVSPADYPWLEPMRDCQQNPRYHAEGDVWTHTLMVCEELAAGPRFRALDESDRKILWACALLHDVAKPDCTRIGPDGELTSAGHARRGAVMARRILWQMDVPYAAREQICGLIRHHMVPFWALEKPVRLLLEVSQTARCDLLSIQAEADARGRQAPDRQKLIDEAVLFADYAREHGCASAPYAFPTPHTRFAYFRSDTRAPDQEAYDDTRCRVHVLSGLPGAGKDTYLQANLPDLPVVSLDAIRRELRIKPTDDQAPVAERARELAREHLRAKREFVWNATNLSRDQRERCLGLMADYHAWIRLIYCETSCAELMRRNAEREPPFPGAALERLLDRWEIPDLTECHELVVVRSENGETASS